jgi:cysteine synthase A
VANCLGYKAHIVMPDKISSEKINHLRFLGATVEVLPSVPLDDPNHFFKVAERRANEIDGGFYINQFYNENNLKAHYETTGPEVWEQTEGTIDAVVLAAGTGLHSMIVRNNFTRWYYCWN